MSCLRETFDFWIEVWTLGLLGNALHSVVMASGRLQSFSLGQFFAWRS